MKEIVEGGKEPNEAALFRLPVFDGLESLAVQLAAVRQEAAEAREPSQELLAKLESAIAAVQDQQDAAAAGAVPAVRTVVVSYLALLFKGYINAGQQDGRVFGRLMREDILSAAPPVAAVEIACRRWRQKSKFLPAISELLAEVKAAKIEVENAVEFARRLPALRDRMARELGGS